MSLKEAIAVAIEQGNLGSQGGPQNAGLVNDNLVQFGGRAVGGTDTIRALVSTRRWSGRTSSGRCRSSTPAGSPA